MVVSPALQRGDRERKKGVSPVGAMQKGAQNAPMHFLRLPWYGDFFLIESPVPGPLSRETNPTPTRSAPPEIVQS
jgi:hypothetical protein